MKKKYTKYFFLTISGFIFLLFSSCFEVKIETVLNSNGSGIRIFQFRTQYSDLYNEFKMQLQKDENFSKWEKMGAKIEESKTNGKYQLIYTIPFKNVIQLNEKYVTYSFSKSGIFKLEYVYIERWKERKEKEYIGEMFSIQSSLNMPGQIVYSNPLGEINNNTLIWNLNLNELQNGKVLIIKSVKTNWLIIILFSIITIGIFGIAVFRIFLRNLGVKEKIGYFFTRTKDKIKVTQLKLKFTAEERKRDTLIMHLGQKSCDSKVETENAKHFKEKLFEFDKEIEKNQRDVDRIDKDIKEYEDKKREMLNFYISEIEKQEELKSPKEHKLKELKDKRRTCFKDIENVKKELRKEVEESKKKELESNIVTLEEKLKKLEKEINEGKSIVQAYTEKIKNIKSEQKEKIKEIESKISQFKKNIDELKDRNREIEYKKLLLFKELGNVINKERVKIDELNPIYSQIDEVDKNIEKIKREIDILR